MPEVFTVEQLAQALDVHPKTIRRYIRDGKLEAHKVGGQWRIASAAAEAFFGGQISEHKKELEGDLAGFVSGTFTEIEGPLQICTIVDYYVSAPHEAKPIADALVDLMNSDWPRRGRAKYQYLYDPDEQKARFVIWGHPRFMAAMMEKIAEHVEQTGD